MLWMLYRLPWWTHKWHGNRQFKGKNGKKSRRCAANRGTTEHAFDFLKGLFDYVLNKGKTPVFAHMEWQDMHTPNPDWAISASDEAFAAFLTHITQQYPTLAVVIYGDHGRGMPFLNSEEGDFEILNPYLVLVQPRSSSTTKYLSTNKDRAIVPWLVRHAACIINYFKKDDLGITPWQHSSKGRHRHSVHSRQQQKRLPH